MDWVRGAYFNNATDAMISESEEIARDNFLFAQASYEFPGCPDYTETTCSSDYEYFNELTCSCLWNHVAEGCNACDEGLVYHPT